MVACRFVFLGLTRLLKKAQTLPKEINSTTAYKKIAPMKLPVK